MKSKTHIPIDGSVHQRIPVVDIDAHVGEQANLWVDRIEPKTDEQRQLIPQVRTNEAKRTLGVVRR